MPGKSITRIILFIIILLNLTACTDGGAGPLATPTYDGARPVDRLFSDIYRSLGDAVGPVISPKFVNGSMDCQYTRNALMCYDPTRSGESQFFLAPLASSRGLEWPVLPATSETINFDGVPTRSEFYAFLHKYFTGTRFAGRPISPLVFNYQEQRVEQVFENVLLYHQFHDALDEVHLVPLGYVDCREKHPDLCAYHAEMEDALGSLVGYIEAPYPQVLAGLGDLSAFGRVLTPPYQTADGRMEQIWENVVFTWPVDQPEQARLFPLADWMRMPGTQPGPQVYQLDSGVLFFPVKDGLGFHVPQVFDEFNARHGGIVFSGPPTGDYMLNEDGSAIRQCFENYCLIYDRNPVSMPKDLRVRLLPLGVAYRDQYYLPDESQPVTPPSPAGATLQVSESWPQVTSQEAQVIKGLALDAASGRPLRDLQLRVRLPLPDGSLYEVLSPASDGEGQTSLQIPAQPGFRHGQVVTYEACLLIPAGEPVCQTGLYLIWDLP